MDVGRKNRPVLLVSLALTMPLASCPLAEPLPPGHRPYKLDPGRHLARQNTDIWYDEARGRAVPVRVYRPETGAGPFPAIIFSHGLMLSRDHYTYLGRHWVSHGYVVVYLSHPGSDTAILTNGNSIVAGLLWAAADPENRRERPRDVSFAIDRLRDDPVLGHLVDVERIGVAGHSFGAFTALATVGMRVDLPDEPAARFGDPRVKAAIAMSPQGPDVWGLTDDSWDGITRPCMSMMGTLDTDPLVTDAAQRRAPFELCPGPDQFLVTIEGAMHWAFDDTQLWPPNYTWESRYHDYVKMATTAFFDAYLMGQAGAQRWLLERGLEHYSGRECRVEYKNTTAVGGDEN
jgi:predicted dienelactone hydrolase